VTVVPATVVDWSAPASAAEQTNEVGVGSDARETVTFQPVQSPERQQAPLPDDRAPAGYEILGVLGRGGMGVVYLARQTRLNRPCALKMILAAEHAGDTQRERFETEAQAIARLQHENIVRIYEIGQHQGQPFMALEFCEGGSLARKLRQQQPTPREAATLVRTLALGIQAAHAAQVIHRDLKPANVLLSAEGTAKVTDFGLAKKLDEAGQTHTGTVLGTPSYMPPEQARGERDLGPAVDIYALGAILYECLTGRPPFKAATALETIHQVLASDPVSVRQLNPSVARDLETIVHKCLQKDPRRRYASAQDLAADLERFLNGEPVRARPVGRFERGVRWVQRNPLVSALATAVLLVLTAGVVTASMLAAWAMNQTEVAKQKADDLRSRAAQGLVGRLALQAQPDQPLPALSASEIKALWELATTTDEQLRERFVRVALEDSDFTRQLKDRAALALHAAVGLDQNRRTRVEALLGQGIIDSPLPTASTRSHVGPRDENNPQVSIGLHPRERILVALCLAQLGRLEPARAGKTAALLDQAMKPMTNAVTLLSLARGLGAVAPHLDAAEASAVCDRAAVTLAQTLNGPADPGTWRYLAEGMTAVAAHLTTRQAAQAAGPLLRALDRNRDPATARALATALAALAHRTPGEAASIFIQGIIATEDPVAWQILVQGLARAAAHFAPPDRAATAAKVAQAIGQRFQTGVEVSLAEGLLAVTVSLKPEEVAPVCRTAAGNFVKLASMIKAPGLARGVLLVTAPLPQQEAAAVRGQVAAVFLAEQYPQVSMPNWIGGLAAVSALLEPREAAARLAQAMTPTTNVDALRYLAEELARVTVRLSPAEASGVRGRAATLLSQTMTGQTDRRAVGVLAEGLLAVARSLPSQDAEAAVAACSQALAQSPGGDEVATLQRALSAAVANLAGQEAAQVCGQAAATLATALGQTTAPKQLTARARGLEVLAARLEAREAAEVATVLLRTLPRTTDFFARLSLVRALNAVAANLAQPDAAVITTRIGESITPTAAPLELRELAEGLSVAAARLKAEEAAPVCAAAADTLLRVMEKGIEPFLQGHLSEGVRALAVHLEAKRSDAVLARVSANLSRLVSGKTDTTTLRYLAEELTTLAARRSSAEAATLCGPLVAPHLQAMARSKDASVLRSLAYALALVTRQLAARDAVNTLVQALNLDQLPPDAVQTLTVGLTAAATRLEPREAAATLTQAMSPAIRLSVWLTLAQELAEQASRLPEEAVCGPAVDNLLQALSGTTNLGALRSLGQSLAALAGRLDAQKATAVAATLVQTMTRTADPAALGALATGLWAATAQLAPEDAAAILLQALTTTDPDAGSFLLQGLAEVLDHRARAFRPGNWAATVGLLSGGTTPLGPLGLSVPLLEAPLPPWPAPLLVELLKNPFCVGAARQLVLEQLGRHYQRRFADQWDFVDFAQANHLDLDFTSPPRKP
jgi:hypothetical protein